MIQNAEILSQFCLEGKAADCQRYGNGHINDTYKVDCENGVEYILQRLNGHVFPHPNEVMENIARVTGHLRQLVQDPRGVLRLIPTQNGADYYVDDTGSYWRLYNFVGHSLCLERAESPRDFYESGVAFGRFQSQLTAFPAASLYETIKDFHNTPVRYQNFKRAVKADAYSRAGELSEDIAFLLQREEEMSQPAALLKSGALPLRVTHNDTKLNNVMLDETTRKALCVIDLDTVMPGLSIFDYGDSIRFGASTASEDERNLSLVSMDLTLFKSYTEGFLQGCDGGLTKTEIETLPLGAKTMTLECGMRFLTDYLEGDIYFKTARPAHNLDRWRTQKTLVADMEKKWSEMQSIVREVAK